MSLAWSRLVWRSEAPRGADRLALLALAEHADDAGVCWPGQDRLAAYCGVSERAIRSTLARLDEAGYIERTPRGRGTRYQLVSASLTPAVYFRSREGATPEADCRSVEPDTGSPLPENTGSPAHDTGSPASRHRKSTAAEPSENPQEEPSTEPALAGSVGLVERGSGEDVGDLVSRLERLGVTDPELDAKVTRLVEEYPDHVGPVLTDLERQRAGAVQSPLGWLTAQVGKAARGLHRPADDPNAGVRAANAFLKGADDAWFAQADEVPSWRRPVRDLTQDML